MTKAKAIEVLNEAYDGFLIAEKVCSDAFKDEITDRKIALLTAIDALTVKTEHDNSFEEQDNGRRIAMDDYISKQSVIDYLNGYLHSLGDADTLFDRGQRRALINSIQDISVVKAADVQPVKHGNWIPSDDKNWLTCPFCDADVDVSVGILMYVDNDEVSHINFCPNCGARMDGDIE